MIAQSQMSKIAQGVTPLYCSLSRRGLLFEVLKPVILCDAKIYFCLRSSQETAVQRVTIERRLSAEKKNITEKQQSVHEITTPTSPSVVR